MPAISTLPLGCPCTKWQRNDWYNAPAFSKLGTADDSGNLYEHLRAGGVEFYVSDPRLFTMEAFHDWNIGTPAEDPVQQPGSSLSVLPYD